MASYFLIKMEANPKKFSNCALEVQFGRDITKQQPQSDIFSTN
jgi:hypothetical protein